MATSGTASGAGGGTAAAADGRSHAHLVVNLKQAIRQLRRELETARAERDAMADSLKFTDMEELSLIARANFEEVQRLQLLLQSRGDGGEGEDDEDEFDLTPSGVRPTAMAMHRLENEARFLRDENASLKADLNKVRRGVAIFDLLCLLCTRRRPSEVLFESSFDHDELALGWLNVILIARWQHAS